MSDQFVAATQTGKVIWRFAAAADEDIKEGDEIRFDDRTLNVRAVSVTGSGRRLQAMCEEVR